MSSRLRSSCVAALFVLIFVSEARACSCERWTRAQGIVHAGTVFEGRVLSARPLGPAEGKINFVMRIDQAVRVAVIEALKGDMSGEVEVLPPAMNMT